MSFTKFNFIPQRSAFIERFIHYVNLLIYTFPPSFMPFKFAYLLARLCLVVLQINRNNFIETS